VLLTGGTYETHGTNGTWVGFAFPVWCILLPSPRPDEDEDEDEDENDDEYENDGVVTPRYVP
jgi:hypothetical protein